MYELDRHRAETNERLPGSDHPGTALVGSINIPRLRRAVDRLEQLLGGKV